MPQRTPPRYLPTLTEIVQPHAGYVPAEGSRPAPLSVTPSFPSLGRNTPVAAAPPDRHALAQQLIKLVKPQLEAELRNIAQELFEAQFSALLPSLHMQIEEAVREAIEQALPDPIDRND
jgi:hypothetical protein